MDAYYLYNNIICILVGISGLIFYHFEKQQKTVTIQSHIIRFLSLLVIAFAIFNITNYLLE